MLATGALVNTANDLVKECLECSQGFGPGEDGAGPGEGHPHLHGGLAEGVLAPGALVHTANDMVKECVEQLPRPLGPQKMTPPRT